MYQPECNLVYQYDASGAIIGFTYHPYSGTATLYFFGKNAQGDVICIYDATGNTVARYNYDAWGACTVAYDNTSIGIANINPIRYRSYYYDTETGWYYLQSRYYDPAVGRFISPDDPSLLGANGDLLSYNLYAYCSNNPANHSDPSGYLLIGSCIAIALVAAVLGGGVQLYSNAKAGATGSELWNGVAGAAVGSATNALVLFLLAPYGVEAMLIAAFSGSLTQTGVNAIEANIRGENYTFATAMGSITSNFFTNAIGNLLGAALFPTGGTWFRPKLFKSVFLKPYGQKIILQTIVGAICSRFSNYITSTFLTEKKQNDFERRWGAIYENEIYI
jgi:RHS repeat-associated protein